MYKLHYYVPVEFKEKTKQALFDIGIGRFENYENCSWECLGNGQFRAIGNANPTLGKLDELEVLQEYKIEMVCTDELIEKAVKTLKEAHPYEEVAYEVFKMQDY